MSPEEQAIWERVLVGEAVPANLRRHGELIELAQREGRYQRIDRRTRWGNPFVVGRHGTREEVIALFARDHLPKLRERGRRPSELRGKVLGCWCAPEPCHGDVLAEWVKQSHL